MEAHATLPAATIFLTCFWVYSCLNLKAQTISLDPIHLYKKCFCVHLLYLPQPQPINYIFFFFFLPFFLGDSSIIKTQEGYWKRNNKGKGLLTWETKTRSIINLVQLRYKTRLRLWYGSDKMAHVSHVDSFTLVRRHHHCFWSMHESVTMAWHALLIWIT